MRYEYWTDVPIFGKAVEVGYHLDVERVDEPYYVDVNRILYIEIPAYTGSPLLAAAMQEARDYFHNYIECSAEFCDCFAPDRPEDPRPDEYLHWLRDRGMDHLLGP